MPGLNHAVNSYANTVTTLRNGVLIGLVVVILIAVMICQKKKQ